MHRGAGAYICGDETVSNNWHLIEFSIKFSRYNLRSINSYRTGLHYRLKVHLHISLLSVILL